MVLRKVMAKAVISETTMVMATLRQGLLGPGGTGTEAQF